MFAPCASTFQDLSLCQPGACSRRLSVCMPSPCASTLPSASIPISASLSALLLPARCLFLPTKICMFSHWASKLHVYARVGCRLDLTAAYVAPGGRHRQPPLTSTPRMSRLPRESPGRPSLLQSRAFHAKCSVLQLAVPGPASADLILVVYTQVLQHSAGLCGRCLPVRQQCPAGDSRAGAHASSDLLGYVRTLYMHAVTQTHAGTERALTDFLCMFAVFRASLMGCALPKGSLAQC